MGKSILKPTQKEEYFQDLLTKSKIIGDGAEATIYKFNEIIIKHRPAKSYRHHELDYSLRNSRTKREAKVLTKLQGIIPAPKLLNLGKSYISMEFIDGSKMRDWLKDNYSNKIFIEIGQNIAKMHDEDIIHGDLTTSNMILRNKEKKTIKKDLIKQEIVLIDFGLSDFSIKIEDKAVDLHLLRQALESKHPTIWEKAFNKILEGYKTSKTHKEVLKRFELVESRGRNKKNY